MTTGRVRVRVIGLGSAAGGDDAVGLVVVEALRRDLVSEGTVEYVLAPDPSALVDLVCDVDRVVLVDAAVGPAVGEVLLLDAAALGASAAHGEPSAPRAGAAPVEGVAPGSRGAELAPDVRPALFSSHGVGVGEAVALARVLHGARVAPEVAVVAIGIAAPGARAALELGPEVAAAVARARAVVRAWVRAEPG